MKNIVAFGASNSSTSINKQLAICIANSIDGKVKTLDLNDYEMPIFSVDKEKASGIPQLAYDFKEEIEKCDGVVISFAEHNGAYSTAFKNIFDWISRINNNVWCNKPMFLAATSDGSRGGASVLEMAVNKISRMTKGGLVSFCLPLFNDNFKNGEVVDGALKEDLVNKVTEFEQLI